MAQSRIPCSASWPLALVALLSASGCPSFSREEKDLGPRAGEVEAEQRFGNDPELVADFNNLSTCHFSREKGRLDQACPQLQTLAQRLRTKRRKHSSRIKLVRTLANLLGSRKERTRLAANESLYPHLQEPVILAALKRAQKIEEVPGVRAAMLRQLCLSTSLAAVPEALSLLAGEAPEVVRAQAATCLGRPGKRASTAVKVLMRVLREDPSPLVQGRACTSLGQLGKEAAGQAVPRMAALLGLKETGWRCASALAALGTGGACKALRKAVVSGLERGSLAAQMVSALASFAAGPHLPRPEAQRVLERVVLSPRLSHAARLRAAQELFRIGGREVLLSLKARLAASASTSASASAPGPDAKAGSGQEGDSLVQAVDRMLRD